MASTDVGSPSWVLLKMMSGCWVSQAIYVAAKLGIADLLYDGPKPCSALAKATQTHAGALYRILRALASLGVFAEDEEGCFCLTPLAECLQSGVPGALRAYAVFLGEEVNWRAWGDALYSVRTGQPAFDHAFGMSRHRYFAEHPEAGRVYNDAIMSRSDQEDDAIISAYDFSDLRIVVDVGGGQGTLLAAILHANPNTQGVLFELPHVIASARPALEKTEQAPRYEFRAGDFFGAVPGGGDVYLLKKVIMDWDDERAGSILKNCRKVMGSAGRLLLIEPIIPLGNSPSFSKLLDLQMLVLTPGGRGRTEAEHRTLLASAGFELARIIPTKSAVSIIEARPT